MLEENEFTEVLQELRNNVTGNDIPLPTNSPVHSNHKEEQIKLPDYNSPEWEPYIMTLFTPDELIDGKYPKMSGLRRVGGLVLGDAMFSGIIREYVNLPSDGIGRVTVVFKLTILWKLNMPAILDVNRDFPVREFIAIGGSYEGNTDDLFAIFPEAIAETRAEARCWRRALRLSVCSSDEMTNKNKRAITDHLGGYTNNKVETKSASDTQIKAIIKMCERMKIEMSKLLTYHKCTDVKHVSYDLALKIISDLNDYQRGMIIPKELA